MNVENLCFKLLFVTCAYLFIMFEKTMPNEQPNTTKCNNVTTTTRDDGIVGAIRSYVSRTTTNETKARGEIGRKLWINPVLDVSSKRKPRELVVSVIKGVLKRIVP